MHLISLGHIPNLSSFKCFWDIAVRGHLSWCWFLAVCYNSMFLYWGTGFLLVGFSNISAITSLCLTIPHSHKSEDVWGTLSSDYATCVSFSEDSYCCFQAILRFLQQSRPTPQQTSGASFLYFEFISTSSSWPFHLVWLLVSFGI